MKAEHRKCSHCTGCDPCMFGGGFDCPPYMSMSPKVSSHQDLVIMRDYLSSRYTATTLMQEVRGIYDNEYMARFGIRNALQSYLFHIRDKMGLSISSEDIGRISDAVIVRGDITYRGVR